MLKRNSKQLDPKLIAEWHSTKNGDLDPYNIGSQSQKRVWWQCEKGHEWPTYIFKRTNVGTQCPYCKHKKASAEYNLELLHPEIAQQWSPTNSLKPYEVTPKSNKKVWWSCKDGHEWRTSPNKRVSGKGCPHCKKNISKVGGIWLDGLGITTREYHITTKGKRFIVDGIDVENRIIYEFLGDYWHGNPKVYSSDKQNKSCNKSFGELFLKTMEKFNMLYEAGFTIIYHWESDSEDSIYVPSG